MYQVSQQFRQALSLGAIHHIRGTITLANEETIALSDDNTKRPAFSQQCTSDPDSFGIGQLYTGTVELTLLDAEDLQRATLRGGTVSLEFGLDGFESEWVPLGIWNITDPQRGSENSIIIRGVDNTSRLDVPISYKTVGHITMINRINTIKALTGLEFAQTIAELSALAGTSVTANSVFGTSYCSTCRAEVSAIAQFIGGIAYFDRTGKIAFRKLGDNPGEYIIPAARRFKADLSEYSYKVTAISYTDDDGTVVTDEASGGDANTRACLPLTDYPYMWQESETDKKTALNRIRDSLASAGVWIPGSIDYAGDPTIDLGDRVYLTGGVTGVTQSAFIVTAQTWQFRGPHTLIAAGAAESAVYSGGGGSSGASGGSSTTIIEDSLNYVKMRGIPGEISGEPVTVALAAFDAKISTMLHISVSAVVEGSESGVTSLSVYLDDSELDMLSEDTIAAGELRTIHFEQMHSAASGSHTLTVKAVGLGSIRRITGSIWGKKISADVSMIRTWGDASVFKWSDILLLKWGDINGTND